MRKEKSYWNLKKSQKQELNSYEVNQFQSISSSGRTYPLKILHGRMRILYRSTQSYSSGQHFFEGEGYVRSLYYQYSPLLFLVQPPYLYCCTFVAPILLLLCPIKSHYCYFYALKLLLLGQIGLYCDPMDSYIQKGGFFICIIQ